MASFWLAVASADHVQRGQAGGFMQVCHGRAGPLRRIKPGDGIVYYSPATTFRGKDGLKAFTAIGIVREGEPYRAAISDEFQPYRRDVVWTPVRPAPVAPLLGRLELTRGKPNWGYQLRFGVLPIGADDFRLIAAAMDAASLAAEMSCRDVQCPGASSSTSSVCGVS